jgi:hypothetical protein
VVSNISVLLVSLATFQIGFGAFRTLESSAFELGVFGLMIGCLCWALGAAASRVITGRSPYRMRWLSFVTLLVAAGSWPWVGSGTVGWITLGLAAFVSGVFIPIHVRFVAQAEALRRAYGRMLFGGAIGSVSAAFIDVLFGVGGVFAFAAAAIALAPFLESSLFFGEALSKYEKWRFGALPISAALLVLVGLAPDPQLAQQMGNEQNESALPTSFGNELAFESGEPRKLDILMAGPDLITHVRLISEDVLKGRIRSVTLVEEKAANLKSLEEMQFPEGLELKVLTGDVRRFLLTENRRFDVIQILTLRGLGESVGKDSIINPQNARVTVESVRLFLERLKEEGVLHFPRTVQGEWAESLMATLAEAWKKIARPNVNLHIIGIADASKGALVLRTAMIRLKPFMKEDRDIAEKSLGIHSLETSSDPSVGQYRWVIATEGSGVILTDDRPILGHAWSKGPIFSILSGSIAVLFFGIVYWIVSQERRKEMTSRWQTFSVATFFGGLGISFAFFEVFFVMQAMRSWGAPEIALGLAMSAILGSLALGATVFASHPKRRYGVRIQPLANFVFAVLFTYLALALFEPMMNSSPLWLASFIGMSVLIPFGILGGGFFPNALEEASERLPPRAVSLLWALFSLGSGVGICGGAYVALNHGLDLTYLAGLFCFAWVAISSGLIRPWSLRKPARADR